MSKKKVKITTLGNRYLRLSVPINLVEKHDKGNANKGKLFARLWPACQCKIFDTLWLKMRLLWHTTSLLASTKFSYVVAAKWQAAKKANKGKFNLCCKLAKRL